MDDVVSAHEIQRKMGLRYEYMNRNRNGRDRLT